MKLELIVANEEALKVLVETKLDDAQLAWDLSETFDEVEKAITKFQKKRDEYIKSNGTPDPKTPERYNIANPEEFTNEMKKLLDVEVDITFPVVPFEQLKGIKLSPREMKSWKALGILKNPPKKTLEDVGEAEEVKEEVKETVK